MSLPARSKMTPDEYLTWEAANTVKHEYVRGEVFAMSGVTDWHNEIAFQACALLKEWARDRGCRVFIADVKLRVERANCYFYPDVFVTCDERDAQDRLIKRHAQLVVEVLSESTAEYDRGAKFDAYRQLDSLQAYVLVETAQRRVNVYERQASPFWRYASYDATQQAHIDALDLTLDVGALYDGTDVPG